PAAVDVAQLFDVTELVRLAVPVVEPDHNVPDHLSPDDRTAHQRADTAGAQTDGPRANFRPLAVRRHAGGPRASR
ncbi:MAG TPA: hypothetical protein PLB21_15720, partial [Actinomycetota bacterium]|nr:hypothetical protein [Actinomycetota bacterium]